MALLAAAASSDAQVMRPWTSADRTALTVAIYARALANGMRTAHAAAPPEGVCVQGMRPRTDPSEAVINAHRKDGEILVRPMSACVTEGLGGEPPGASLVIDTLTGKRGIRISATAPTFNVDGTFTFQTRYYQNGRSAGDWRCAGRRRGMRQWEIISCRLERIS